MSLKDDFRVQPSPLAAGGVLSRLRLRRNRTGISISRWPRGRRLRQLKALGLGLLALGGIGAAVAYVAGEARVPESAALQEAADACASKATCVEWRVTAKCTVPSLIGRARTRTQTFEVLGRSQQEAAWMIAHFERECVVEAVDYRGPLSLGRRLLPQ